MRILAFSDLHRDVAAARAIVEGAGEADVVVGAGDFAVMRRGLADVIEMLSEIETPTVLVPGNAESDEELRDACRDWAAAKVLHGEGVEIAGVPFFGLGAAVPITPFGSWSFDIAEEEAARRLSGCPEGCVLVTHSPPHGHADRSSNGEHLGSTAVTRAIRRVRPRLVVCGHVHDSWGERSDLDGTPVINVGPGGARLEID